MTHRHRRNPTGKQEFLVLRIDRDNSDTYSKEIAPGFSIDDVIDDTLDAALPDRGSVVEWGKVTARDAGAARLMRPASWTKVTTKQMNYWRSRQFATDIRGGMARALWVTAYADWVDEQPKKVQKELAPGPGGDWNDVAPETPESADDAAMALYESFEMLNGKKMGELLEAACDADDIDPSDEIADEFGHALAMQALGHGVGWTDDHAEFDIQYPRHWEARTDDGETLDWSPRRNPHRR